MTSAGTEIHFRAGEKIVIEAGVELTVKAGGSFIKLDVGGLTMIGPIAKVNAVGSAGTGTGTGTGGGIGIKPPRLPVGMEQDKAGSLMGPALVNAPPEKVEPKAFFVFSDKKNRSFYED